jgi:hypothetical protein
MYNRLTSNLQSFCLILPSVGITGIQAYTTIPNTLLFKKFMFGFLFSLLLLFLSPPFLSFFFFCFLIILFKADV